MQVYIELALIENFCMDFTLLYSAKLAVKNPVRTRRIVLASLLGAVFAVVFPLFNLNAVWQVVLKVASGLLICLVAGKFKGLKSYFKFSFAFLIFTALLGGALVGIFSLTGLSYLEGEGYLLLSVPIGIPLFFALLIIIGARRLAIRLKKSKKGNVNIRIYSGENCAETCAFFDSGNRVYFHGSPVNVIPKVVAEKLVDESSIKDGVKIHTVAGSKFIKTFTCDRIEIDYGEKTETVKKVTLGISPQNIDTAVLHCDILEDIKV
ncbi:MAG: hypothetical protein HDQ88_00055 [Clostridia bacterium]|nr:hypothetical protein [Clostridia bacterium]